MEDLSMRFQLKTIDHLGVKLYNYFPPVIAELISNSYDADATEVTITINYEDKEVVVEDDGHGMTLAELNDNFLVIGRNRRSQDNDGYSPGGRKVTGKKGLGKLAVFGIAEEITISSVKDNLKNEFTMNYPDIKNNHGEEIYHPNLIHKNLHTNERDGTKIIITNITINNITKMDTLSENLSSRFKFFDSDFVTKIINKQTNKELIVTNELYYNRIDKEFEWNFPKDFQDQINENASIKWLNDNNISGKVLTQRTPLQKKHSGFIVYSRNKLVQENTFFSDRSNDNFHTYVTGHFSVNFIDDDLEKDFVATDRKSLLWNQSDELQNLKYHLNKLVNKIGNEWKTRRRKKREEAIEETIPQDFYDGITPPDKKILQTFQRQLANSIETDADAAKVGAVMESLKKQFKFEYFKNYVFEMNDTEVTLENMEKISDDWESIEIHEMSKIALGRIETINRFEKFINENASETKYIQPFLEKFPWILDPRMSTFDREVTFSRLLKERYPDEKLDESNRRIDFLCSNANGLVHIIELKRPNIKITPEELYQALDYSRFIEEHRTELSNVRTFLVSDNLKMDPTTEKIYNSLNSTGDLIIRSYTDMIDQAKSYHKQFIDAIEEVKEAKS
ncbi:ATP-binding protein [Halobacillus halophilus]|uniref:ATP-binding protein n=1 Tax=Halobacillus halophilus TaxID=1570 RepID=UPI001CD77B45|nr:ATP-binding protein [Halobacillus halophilus]MCA1011762.1 ATP-binding protein [Halobacillus halophilus]